MESLYDLISAIQKKPGMYIGSASITSLHMFLLGYKCALQKLDKPKSLQQEEAEFKEFQSWIADKFGVKSSSISWSKIILLHSLDERDAFNSFFDLLNEFRGTKNLEYNS